MGSVVRSRAAQATCVAAVICAACALWTVADFQPVRLDLLAVLTLGALAGHLLYSPSRGGIALSGSFLAFMVGVGFLGGPAAFAMVAVAELGAWAIERYRLSVAIVNIASFGLPVLIAGVVLDALNLSPEQPVFYVVLGALGLLALGANILLLAPGMAALDGVPIRERLPTPRSELPAMTLNTVLAMAAAALYHRVGIVGAIVVVSAVLGLSYMARLIGVAQVRARQYAALSWGVLAGLVRALDTRDPRASRHSAAVAAFSRDVAAAAGFDTRQQELAHTAGLLHDIGRFALSDRVMDRGRPLTTEDWTAIRRHPELGADLLRDLGHYGPVAEIVLCHHERVDGRGYPGRLPAEKIPELAKIIAVAEVYDTLTADDTYRTPVSSFEALTELRRVAGSQLDPRYVETLAKLLAGRGTEYRHAREADFTRELDLERRMEQSIQGG